MSGLVLDFVMFAGGMVALFFGGDWLVDGSSAIAKRFGIRPIIVGLTVVAFGTSAPELVVSLLAAVKGTDAVAVGNVIGSNIANIALILGVAPLIAVISIRPGILKREYVFALGTSLLAWVLAMDGMFQRWDGAILLAGLVVFLAWTVRTALAQRAETAAAVARGEVGAAPPPTGSLAKQIGLTLVGIAALIIGAQLLVEGAVGIARFFQVPELVIGLSVVSLGTSLPELVTSVAGARKGEDEIAVGNILGSNVFNICAVLGSASAIISLPVDTDALWRDFPIMVGFTVLLFVLMRWGFKLDRLRGLILLSGYLSYVLFIYLV